MSAGGDVSGSKDQLPTEDHSNGGPRRRLYGLIALTLWGLALACSLVDAAWTFDRIRVLVLTRGLMMIDIAAALLFSNWWFIARRVVEPMTDCRVALRYGYEAGHTAGYTEGYDDGVITSDNAPVIHLASRRLGRFAGAPGARGNVDDHVS